jgi:Uma2 family endonuclease
MATLSEPLPASPAAPAQRRKRFTRQEVEQLLESGFFLGQRYELIDGDLIDKMGQKPPHAYGVESVSEWLREAFPGRRVRVQLPIELTGQERDLSVPEPDVAVLKERRPEYQSRHPRSDELVLVVEIADSSAPFDLGRKAEIYAGAGVPQYWVLDLNRRMLVIHTQSDGKLYRSIQLLSEDQAVRIQGRSIRVGELLPERA